MLQPKILLFDKKNSVADLSLSLLDFPLEFPHFILLDYSHRAALSTGRAKLRIGPRDSIQPKLSVEANCRLGWSKVLKNKTFMLQYQRYPKDIQKWFWYKKSKFETVLGGSEIGTSFGMTLPRPSPTQLPRQNALAAPTRLWWFKRLWMKPSDERCARRVHPKFKKQLQKPLSTKLIFVHSVTNNTIDKVQLHELLYLTFMTNKVLPTPAITRLESTYNLLQSKSSVQSMGHQTFQTLTCPTWVFVEGEATLLTWRGSPEINIMELNQLMAHEIFCTPNPFLLGITTWVVALLPIYTRHLTLASLWDDSGKIEPRISLVRMYTDAVEMYQKQNNLKKSTIGSIKIQAKQKLQIGSPALASQTAQSGGTSRGIFEVVIRYINSNWCH